MHQVNKIIILIYNITSGSTRTLFTIITKA